MTPTEDGMREGATFSHDRTFRYHLWRRFDRGVGRVAFIGLNPSSADETTDDPTVRRCMGFGRGWGYAYLDILNLFAFRSTEPRQLRLVDDPIGPENDEWLEATVLAADLTVAAWGTHGVLSGRGDRVRRMLKDCRLHHLGLTKDKHPKHPLYLRADTKLKVWT